MTANSLAPCFARSSVAMELIICKINRSLFSKRMDFVNYICQNIKKNMSQEKINNEHNNCIMGHKA